MSDEHEPRWHGTGYGGGVMVCRCGDQCEDGYNAHVTGPMNERDVEAVLAEHEPALGRFGGVSGIVGCSCLSARDYRAAGHRAGQGGWRTHLAAVLVAALRGDT